MDFLNIFELIILSSLIGSLIVLMILIIKGIFKNKLNPTFYYYIWFILIIKLILPFGPKTSFNITNVVNSSKQVQTTAVGNSILTSEVQTSNKSVINNATAIPIINKINIEKMFCFIWMLGVLLLIGIVALGHKKLRKIVLTSIKDISSTHKEILDKCRIAMNIKTKVEIVYSGEISSPSLCGSIKPKILIPMSLGRDVCDEEFKYILMHELTHLKKKDIFINWIITLLSMIYWFNPVLLYGFHKMRQDCEFSCDDAVISYLNEGENLQYGNAIIRVLQLGGNSDILLGTTSMVMNNSELKRRITMISKYKKINIKNILLGVIIVVIIGGLGIFLNISKNAAVKVNTPMAIAEKFGRNLHAADAEKVAEYKKVVLEGENKNVRDLIGEGGIIKADKTAQDNYIKMMQSLDKNIQPLMVQKEYDSIFGSRFNTLSAELCAKGNYTLQVTDFILDKNLYGENENKAGYYYEAKLKFISTEGKADLADRVKGYIGLIKENSEWKVFAYKLMVAPKLYTEQMMKTVTP